MAWTTPPNWVNHQTVTEADLDTYLSDNLSALANPDRARAYRSANLSFADSTWDVIPLGSETFDSNGLHSNSTNSSRITAQVAGPYYVCGAVRFLSNATGDRKAAIRKNSGGSSSGGTRQVGAIHRAAPGDVTEIPLATIVELGVGDYVELFAFQSSGGALSIEGGESYNWLAVCALGIG